MQTQPAVTKQVAGLEQQVGVSLFALSSARRPVEAEEVGFAGDSPLEGTGFELVVRERGEAQ